jgi:putative transposase
MWSKLGKLGIRQPLFLFRQSGLPDGMSIFAAQGYARRGGPSVGRGGGSPPKMCDVVSAPALAGRLFAILIFHIIFNPCFSTSCMATTFTQVHIHFIFAVKNRVCRIPEHFREELQQYITGIVQKRNHRLLAIYCMPDHMHVLIGKRPSQSESDLVRDIKTNSSAFIRSQSWVQGQFAWQEGYGAFSHSKSQVDQVINYILNQPVHHQKKSFREEFIELLQRLGIEFEERQLFTWMDDAL